MNDYAMKSEAAVNYPTAGGPLGIGMMCAANPTLRENIDARIQHYKDEIVRLEKVKEQMPQMLDINLRDLREAMNY